MDEYGKPRIEPYVGWVFIPLPGVESHKDWKVAVSTKTRRMENDGEL